MDLARKQSLTEEENLTSVHWEEIDWYRFYFVSTRTRFSLPENFKLLSFRVLGWFQLTPKQGTLPRILWMRFSYEIPMSFSFVLIIDLSNLKSVDAFVRRLTNLLI